MTVAKPVRKIKFLKRLLSGSCGARNYKYIKIKCILFRKSLRLNVFCSEKKPEVLKMTSWAN